tara:strand:- start:3739 stop:4635 length:897 start_codon:yes stop_codon:yes gene_type:complete
MNILILGGSSFIGLHLIRRLAKTKHKVTSFSRTEIKNKLANVNYIQGNFNNRRDVKNALKGMDAIIHLIVSSSPRSSNKSIQVDVETNLINTIQLLELMKEENIKKIIFPSSGCSVYGNNSCANELSALEPSSSYGIIKLAIEKYLKLYEVIYDIEALIFRVSCVYGPAYKKIGSQGIISTTLYKLRSNTPLGIWGDGNSIRDFIFIDDLIDLFENSIKSFRKGVYNAGSGKGYSVLDIISICEKVTKKSAEVNYFPAVKGDLTEIVLDQVKTEHELDWRTKISIEKGIELCWTEMKS